MSKRLVIVESPAKARTIKGFLGPEFDVESSIGHIRDLPERAADVPAKYKKEPWARLGVNVENDFEPLYVIDSEKKQRVADLKKLLDQADELLLATDEDREGEAIAWHLSEVLKPKVPARRMVFHEITRDAIERALLETRDIDARLVDAQETRRILDRLYGYEVSPVLWKKIMPRLSAGRVQSVATRLVVERERARRAFVAAEYWDIEGTFVPGPFTARLVVSRRQARGAGTRLRLPGRARRGRRSSGRAARASAGRRRSTAPSSRSASVEEKPYTRRPAPPFMTSTLQQEASRKLRFTSQTTMRVAQRLYENGYITYMRTDSTTLAESALAAARDQARELYGAEYVPEKPRHYDRKVKNAQEAHEAIRPAGRPLPHSARTKRRALARRARPVRPDLEAHGRLADEGRDRLDRLGAARRARVERRGRRVRRLRDDDHVPRLSRRIRGGPRRSGSDRRRGASVAADERGRPPRGADSSSRRATRRRRLRATRRRRSSAPSRSAASGGRRRTRRS